MAYSASVKNYFQVIFISSSTYRFQHSKLHSVREGISNGVNNFISNSVSQTFLLLLLGENAIVFEGVITLGRDV